jgi:hypothetical protein
MLSAYVIVIGYGAPASTLNSQRSGAGRGWGSLRDGGGGDGGGGGEGGCRTERKHPSVSAIEFKLRSDCE